jgi:integrase/recombinase XerD
MPANIRAPKSNRPPDPMDFESLVENYREHRALLNFSARSWPTARGVLWQLHRYLESQQVGDLAAITADTLQGFRQWLFYEPTCRGTARAIATQNRSLAKVKSFFRFLHEEGLIVRDPAAALAYAREPKSLPRHVLTPQEARRVLSVPDVQTPLGYRDRTILEVLYSTGVRRSELMALTMADVNLEDGLLRINGGKGAKDRVVPLTRIAASFLETYIAGIRPQMLGRRQSDGLFISKRGRTISKNAVAGLVEKYAKLARIKKRITPHCWRHTCATHLVKNAANLRHVQEILGHKNLSSTETYLRLTITDLKEAHRKCHPREREARGRGEG